jgi:hypothetical protein
VRPHVPQDPAGRLDHRSDEDLGIAVDVGDPPVGVDREKAVGHVLEGAGHGVLGQPLLAGVAGDAEHPLGQPVLARLDPAPRLHPADPAIRQPDPVLGLVLAAGVQRRGHRRLDVG